MEFLTPRSELTTKLSGDYSQFNFSIIEILLTLAAQERRMSAQNKKTVLYSVGFS
jgi:hypothetical protein